MCWQTIPAAFVLMEFLQVAAAHCMVHPVPARNFTLPCVLLNETLLSPFSAGSWSGWRREFGAPKTEILRNKESFLCCLWSASSMDCSLHRASLQERSFIPAEINIPAPQQTDWSWNVECWIRGKLDLLVCNLQLLKPYLGDDLEVNLVYSGSELSLEHPGASSSPVRGTVRTARCHRRARSRWRCRVRSPSLAQPYTLWLRLGTGTAALASPPMSLQPTDVVRPEAPENLRLELAEDAQVKLCWASPVLLPFPLRFQVRISGPSGHQRVLEVAEESSVAVDDALLDSTSSVRVRSRNLRGPGFWSGWSSPYNLSSAAQVLYFPSKALASAGSSVSFLCLFRSRGRPVGAREVVWWLNLAQEIPAGHFSPVSERVSRVTLPHLPAATPRGHFPSSALYCCHRRGECHRTYAELYVVDMEFNISCETDGYLTKMTCRWSANPSTSLLGTLQLRYHRSQIYCSDSPSPSADSEVKECHLIRNYSYECTFQPIFLMSGYTLWIEFQHFLGTLESSPVCVVPADVVRPLPPSHVGAELTRNVGLLNVSWSEPVLAHRALEFQIRSAGSREGTPWQVFDVPDSPGSWAVLEVEQPCVEYVVQVRCRQRRGAGLWSAWSPPARTLLQDIRAPLRGPEFWRIISEDPARKQRNITLLWKPLTASQALCSVSSYIIEHQTPRNSSWQEFVDRGTSWSFPWAEPTHTVTVLARNSLGISAVNSHLTLSQHMSTVDAVQSLRAFLVNSTCVVVVWTLCPQAPGIKSFVVEWRNLNKEEELKWLPVPANLSKYFIYDHFILVERYQFSLYPVFAGGVGKARATDRFATGGFEAGSSGSLHVVLPVVFSTSVVLLGALLVSHQRMKKLLWEDVPNPKNCSWAQGVNFQQPEALEQLFAKHPEPRASEPLLLEAEILLEDIQVAKSSGKAEFSGIDPTFPAQQDSGCDSACSRSSRDGGTSAQGELRYATVISNSQPGGFSRRKTNPRNCWDCCFPGENSLVLGGFSSGAWEGGNGEFLVFPGRALSLISSEGFSEPWEEERGLWYLGITALEKGERDIFLSERDKFLTEKGISLTEKDIFPTDRNIFLSERDKFLTERDKFLIEKDKFLTEKDIFPTERDKFLIEKDISLTERDKFLIEKDKFLTEKDIFPTDRNIFLSERDKFLTEKDISLTERDKFLTENDIFLTERDISLSERDKFLTEKDKLLTEKDIFSTERDKFLTENDIFLTERDISLSERDKFLTERDKFLTEKDISLREKDISLREKDISLTEKDISLTERDISLTERDISLTERARDTGQLQSRDLLTEEGILQHIPTNLKEFLQSSLKPKATVPYVPQFGMAAAKGREATEKK